ncbi:MAG TPA: phosphate ABC transporter ATP-binding protein PstB [Solirubrobacterales bacterium]|nr:phosphate ABC transporter ATP-binding protein PstB [Solirubrobacterales bacterium]
MTDLNDPAVGSSPRPAEPLAAKAAPAGSLHSIRLEGLSAFYGDHQAVKDVNMTFEAGEVTAIIGPSGCGKSTMVRCINRMHEEIPGAHADGEILLDDLDINKPNVDVVAVRRAIGMVFQKPNPFPTMSIYDNVAAGLTLNAKRISKAQKDGVVERSLRGAHLWDEVSDRLGKPGGSLSGGQQQRLCIARAIAVEPEVLLMDEPCSALDPVATLAVEDLIGELKSRYTIVIVTHNMQQAARASDVTAFFNLDATGKPGHLVEIGATEEIFTNPNKQETEDYVSGRFG